VLTLDICSQIFLSLLKNGYSKTKIEQPKKVVKGEGGEKLCFTSFAEL
jgi:hypothetical protein